MLAHGASAQFSDGELRLRDRRIDEFLDSWNRLRQGPSRPELYRARPAYAEQELKSAKRLQYRQVMGGFVDRFRPDRRDFRRRLHERCRRGRTLDDALMAHTLSEMAVEALKRHIGVAMGGDDAGQQLLLDFYEMKFLP